MLTVILPSQIRAGRALLDWSQDLLASTAGVGVSTVRELEGQKRAADTPAARAVCQALENAGVAFFGSDAKGGAGVRLSDTRPRLIRRPTVVTKWEGVPFEVEWQGTAITAFVSSEALADLDQIAGPQSDERMLLAFDHQRGRILDATARAITNKENFDRQGRVYVRLKDVLDTGAETAADSPLGRRAMAARLSQFKALRVRPLPKRVWHGQDQEQHDDLWMVSEIDAEKGRCRLANTRTHHFLPIFFEHIRGVLPSTSDDKGGVMELAVQVVFEDGAVRLELP